MCEASLIVPDLGLVDELISDYVFLLNLDEICLGLNHAYIGPYRA